TFLVLVTQIENLGVFDGKTIYRITGVAFISLNNDLYDYCIDKRYEALLQDEETNNSTIPNHPCNDLIKYLSRGTFYFSNDFDLTHCAQNRFLEVGTKKSLSYLESANSNFFWNKYLLKELLNFRKHLLDIEKMELDRSGILLVVIQGFVSISNIRTVDEDSQMCLISRLSCKRVGTRYNARGIDDDGNVANFVESEILFHNCEYYFSFMQIRGSVPLFWEQPQTAQMTHNKKEGSGENVLGKEYDNHFRNSPKSIKNYLNKLDFDFHEKYKNGEYNDCEEILNIINNDLDNYTYFLMKNNEIVSKQLGVVRVNCLDCLDRTNVVETNIAWHIFRKFFLNEKNVNYCSLVYGDDNFKTIFKNIWADNGDQLSRIYAGTGALKSSITRKGKQTVLGYLNDAKKSINRFVNNAFFDKSRQETINLLLGRFDNQLDVILHDPLSDAVQTKLQKQIYKFSSKGNITIFSGTWNVNGQPPNEDLYQWLSPDDDKIPDIYMIGIEEIVELTPQQVMSTDPEKRKIWEKEILRNLRKIDSGYIHLKSKQLVGAFISIYIRDKDVEKVRNVEAQLMKTGLKGLAGNKGGVAISLNYHDSSICFVTAHLAAGQQNVEDRNRDYATISDGIVFKGGRKIGDHDYVIWIGDFNYRINNLANEVVRQMVYDGKLEELLKNDQLINQMAEGKVFEGYHEGHISFRPTYKYDNNSDSFDTSEKARIPAWCDRVLYKGKMITQKYYRSTNLYSSDHKPVKSLFDVEITIVDKETKRKIEKELYEQQLEIYKNAQINNTISFKTNPFLDDDDSEYERNFEQKKASTNNYHWWDLKQINKQRSPDTFSISSNDSFRTDSSPIQSFSSAFTLISSNNGTSSLINEISYDSSSDKPSNPFVAEPEESPTSENSSPTKAQPKPLKSYTGPRQPPKPKSRNSQSSEMSSRSSSINGNRSPTRPASIAGRPSSNPGSAASSNPGTPRPSSMNSKAFNDITNALTNEVVSSPLSETPVSLKPTRPPPPKPPTTVNKPAPPPPSTSKPTTPVNKPAPPPPSTPKPTTPVNKPAPPSTPKPTTPVNKPAPPSTPKPTTPAVNKPAPPKPAPKPKSNSSSPASSNPGTPKTTKKPIVAPKPPPPRSVAKQSSMLRSNTSTSISATANKVNPSFPKSQSSNISSLISSFNSNSIKNRNDDDDDDDNKTVASTRTNVSNISSHLNKAFAFNQEDEKTVINERKEEEENEDLVVVESNVKPSAFKNGIFNADNRKGEEKKITRSATLPDLCKDAQNDNKSSKIGNVASVFKENNNTDSTSNPNTGLIFNKKKQPPPIPQKPKKLNDIKT
ncbi:hypothetical protein PIROE2DRAFT_1378, partial [Piromyces sp. E2]